MPCKPWKATGRSKAVISAFTGFAVASPFAKAGTTPCLSPDGMASSHFSLSPNLQKRITHERYQAHHFVGGICFFAGFAVGPMAVAQRQAGHIFSGTG
jgi:hypothetical protein